MHERKWSHYALSCALDTASNGAPRANREEMSTAGVAGVLQDFGTVQGGVLVSLIARIAVSTHRQAYIPSTPAETLDRAHCQNKKNKFRTLRVGR